MTVTVGGVAMLETYESGGGIGGGKKKIAPKVFRTNGKGIVSVFKDYSNEAPSNKIRHRAPLV